MEPGAGCIGAKAGNGNIEFFKMRVSLNPVWIIGSLLLLGGILRWPTLVSPLAGDEALTFSRYGHLPWNELLFVYRDPNQHVLFSLLSNFSMAVFGENEIAFRAPSFLAGIFGPVALYFLARRLFESIAVALLGAVLFSLAGPSIEYSQLGRGYALTMCLAPVFILCCLDSFDFFSKQTLLFLVVGFALVLALPSNALFLFGVGVWVAIRSVSSIKKYSGMSWETLRPTVLAWGALASFVGVYFYYIREGLMQGAQRYSSDPFDLARWIDVAEMLVSPWGSFLYFLVLIACVLLRRQTLLFVCIFLGPLMLTLVMGIGGYSRTYLFWLPFILLLISVAVIFMIQRLIEINRGAGFTGILFLVIALIVPVGQFLPGHFQKRAEVSAGTMAETREMAAYVQQSISTEALIVLVADTPQGGLIGTHLKGKVERGMQSISAGTLPTEIYFVGHRNAMPDRKPIGDYYKDRSIALPSHSLKIMKTVGNLVLCQFNVTVSRFIPTRFDPDNRDALSPFKTPGLLMERTQKIKVFGEDALLFRKEGNETLLVESRKKIGVAIEKEGNYLLQVYSRNYGQRSRMLMSEKPLAEWPSESGYLNPYFGAFRAGEKLWQLVMVLTPVAAGSQAFRPVFHLDDKESYFDAWQTFWLRPSI